MAIYKRDIVDINLETGNIHRSFLKHSIGYLDQAADHFGIRVLRNGEPVDLTGVTVQGIFMPPQGNPIAITTGNIIEENVAEVVLPQACYNYDGQFCLSIKLVDATNAITGTMRIVDGMVDNTHASGTVAPTETVPTYQEILSVYADMVAALVTVDELDDEVSDLKSALYLYNSMNRIPINAVSKTTGGLTFTSNGDGSYTVEIGTAGSSGANYSLISGNGKFPDGIGAGDSFKISYNGYSKVKLQLYRYINGSLESNVWKETIGEWSEEPVTLGSTVTGLMIRLRVLANVAITTPVTVMPTIMTTKTNKELSEELAELQTAYNSGEYPSASDAVQAQFGSLLNNYNYDFSGETLIPWSIVSSTGKWTTGSSVLFRSYCIELPKNVVSIKVTAGAKTTFFALLDTYSYPPTSGDYPDYADGTGRISVVANTSVSYMIDDDMHYLFVGAINSDGDDNLPTVTMYAPKGSIIDVEGITYLQPTGDQTDRADEIEALLTSTGVCNLGKGDFYVSGIEMPSGSIISGCGKSTRVIMVSGVSSGAVIKMASNCTVSDVTIRGSASGISVSSTVRNLHGILWEGTYTSISGDGEAPTRGTISNVYILYCKGGGITCHGTGTGISNCLNVVNTFINTCDAGINIDFLSEFHRFTNVDCRGCYYGCIDNGGNNTFSNCGFSKNMVGLLMDDSNGQSPNNSHGTFSNCVFNHSGSNNDGYAMRILGMDSGEVFVGCQVFFGKIEVSGSTGILFSSCNIKDGTTFEFTNANVIFVGDVFGGQPTKTETGTNTITVANCYLRDGTPVVFQNAT